MTVKEIRAEIDRHIDKCAVNGFNLMCSILGYIERLLDDLEPSWHVYPEDTPSKDGEYIVTVPFEGVEYVAYAEFEQGRWLLPTFCYNCLGYADTPVAWMELPKPYRKRMSDDT